MVGGYRSRRSSDLAAWHEQIAWVPQRPTIFRGTVAENIRLGARDASDDEVHAAARLAGAHQFALALPLGYADDGRRRRPFALGG